VFDIRPEGPDLRWEDGVIQDIRALRVRLWGNVAMNTEDWLKLLKRAGFTQDCRANDDDEIQVRSRIPTSKVRAVTE
jgi:hypothetical protein